MRRGTRVAGLALALFPLVAAFAEPLPPQPNGFALEKLKVPREQVLEAGPPRDGIRSVDAPEFASLEAAARWVKPYNQVLGVAVGERARAYPVHLMEHHQIVNDTLAGGPVVVSFDPLTSTPRVYRAALDALAAPPGHDRLTFGFSGLLYHGGALLYDRETRSLWSQFTGEAIAGPLAGRRLEGLEVRQEPLAVWADRHPDSTVLARPELKKIDYRYSPYSAYWVSESFPPLPDELVDSRYHPKEVVLGVQVGEATRAYLGSEMTEAGGRVLDEFRGQKLKIAYDGESASFIWEVPEGVQVTDTYWFAWRAHHPDGEVWKLSPPPAP